MRNISHFWRLTEQDQRAERTPAGTLRLFLLNFIVLLLVSCREAPETALPKLIDQLESPVAHERNQACQKLANYGPDAAPATKSLIRRLRDENIGIRSSAAYALRKIGSAEATEALDRYQR